MPFSNLLLSLATVGTTTLAFAIATPVSAQQYYAHHHYAHAHYAYAHTHYTHYRHHAHEGRYIVVHAQEPVVVQTPSYGWGPMGGLCRLSAMLWVEPAMRSGEFLPARA